VHAPLDDRRHSLGAHWPPRPRAGRSPAVTVRLGRHESGRLVILASRTVPGSRPRRLRVLGVLIAPDGTLRDGLHGDDFSQARLERELLAPLRGSGYALASASAPKAAVIVRQAARASLRLGQPLPQAFYLGRDLLGIYDEHATDIHTRGGPAAMLDRAMDLLSAGHARRARPILERYLSQAPESAEGFATLARCLIELGEHDRARAQLLRAIWLDPGNPSHHWNLAAVAHRQGRDGGCYLALIDYLELVGEHGFDQATGACEPRRSTAHRFVSEYERVARLEYPEADPEDVAQADDLLHRARLRLHGSRWEDAVPMLEQALALVPSHYASWAHLGIAHGECNRASEARRCLHRALALRPSYPLAVAALAHLDTRRSILPARLPALPAGIEDSLQAP
jgi:tetratricopeptide (TPR) repeat protein